MDFTGKPMKTMVYVARPGYRTEKQLRAWLDQAIRFTRVIAWAR